MSDRKQRPLLSKLKLIPVAIASMIVFALLSLLGLLNFSTPGSPDGANEEPAQSESLVEATVSAPLAAESTSKNDLEADSPESAPIQTGPAQLVDVLIDGDEYWVATGRNEDRVVRERSSLAEITASSSASEGDSSGVKVRVTRTFSATAQAERSLVAALTDSGLSDDEIDQRRTLVERPSKLGQ